MVEVIDLKAFGGFVESVHACRTKVGEIGWVSSLVNSVWSHFALKLGRVFSSPFIRFVCMLSIFIYNTLLRFCVVT